MDATPAALAALLQLQQLDIDAMRAQKALEELPQRETILMLRKKRAEVEPKKAQVEQMRLETEQAFTKINDEDARLVEKQKTIQEKIDGAGGDYRAVDSLSKELGGIAKRRNTLEAEVVKVSERITQIEAVQNQVNDALRVLDSQESEAIAVFQKEGGKLTQDIARMQDVREKLVEEIGPDLMARYEKKSKIGGGIGVARLLGSACGVCRNTIDEGKLLQIRGEAPISECPVCKRLLVVTHD